jgi:transcriptional regulator with XRE-family HTH domain
MPENERLKKVIFWLISQGAAHSQEELAQKIGYNPSSVSQIVTGIKPLSKKFAGKIASLSKKININYLFGEDEMLVDDCVCELPSPVSEDGKTESEMTLLLQIIRSQQKQMESQQRTIELLAKKALGE